MITITYISDRIGCVMAIVLASRAVDRRFEPLSDQTEDYKIGICCFSANHRVLKRKSNTGWFGIEIMYLSGATCLTANYCFSGLAI